MFGYYLQNIPTPDGAYKLRNFNFFVLKNKKAKKLLQIEYFRARIKWYAKDGDINPQCFYYGGVTVMLTMPEWIISAILLVLALIIIVLVLFQQSDDDGLSGAISGSSSAGYDSYLGKNEGRTTNAKLAKFTKIVAVIFFVLVLVINIINLGV